MKMPPHLLENITPILSDMSLFGGLREDQLESLVPQLDYAHFSKGDVIFRQSDQPTHIYIIQSGRVTIHAETDNQSQEVVNFKVGDCFGETSVIGIQPHSGTATATQDTDLIQLSGETLDHLFKTDKEIFSMLALNIAREASRRLRVTSEHLLKHSSNKIS